MSLISTKDIYLGSGLHKIGWFGKPVAYLLKQIFNIHAVNNLYDKVKDLETDNAIDEILSTLNIEHQIHDEDLKRIPTEGSFILVSNHPLGAIDGLLMMQVLRKTRPDFKIIGNFLLQRIEPLEPIVFPVNPFETRKDVKNSMVGMRDAYKHVKKGNALGVFPAGEVSSKNNQGEITDNAWQPAVLKLIQKANVPIVPMYFHTRNSQIFYRLGKIHPDLQTAMIPTEMMRRRTKPIRIRFGKPITPKQYQDFEAVEDFGNFIRKKTYALASFYKEQKRLRETLKLPVAKKTNKQPRAIIRETPQELLLQDIENLRNKEGAFLFKNNNYECFLSNAKDIKNILNEIGRLREITFREIGEGTNNPLDLDRYDKHYHHLFIWDSEKEKLVGAYRMALGVEVFEKYGLEGFYVNELFNFENELKPFFSRCIEMGRAFVVKEYQQKPMPLFLLWRGIVHVTLRNPKHKYIIGGVSISNQFSDFSKSLMIEFMKSHYYDPFVAQYVRPKKAYKIALKDGEKEFFFDEAKADLNKFDKLIDELEPNVLRLPVLLKKYIKQNAKLIGFNVDPNFNDAVDGLMYIRVSDIPEETVKPVLEELQNQIERDKEIKHK